MRSIQETVEQKFSQFLSFNLPKEHCHLITAFSGGPDSSVLLYLLKKYQENFSYTLSAAYINHNIRPLSVMEAEQSLLISRAVEWGVKLQVKKYPPGFIDFYARKTGTSQEGAARSCRYHFFKKLQNKYENSLLVLGHNRNDQLETLTMRIFQGTGIDGLAGIPERDDTLIRPLLNVSREDILAYAEVKQIPYVTDMTNEEGDYRRNRIRRELLPVLFDIFPHPDSALLDFCREMHRMGRFCSEKTVWQKNGEKWQIPENDFLALPPGVRRNVFLKKMNEINRGVLPRDTRIPGRFLKPLDDLSPMTLISNRVILKGYNIVLEKKGNWVILRKNTDDSSGGLFHLLDEQNPLVTKAFSLSCCKGSSSEKSLFPKEIPLKVKSCLSVRSGKKGNYYLLDGSDTVLELNKNGKIMNFLYRNQKISKNIPNRKEDCVIIKLEVHYAPG